MLKKGWFKIPGVQEGDRSLADQMKGLERLVQAVRGKSVLDLGSAEGLIGIECVKAGASEVVGIESNPPLVEMARRMRGNLPEESRARFSVLLEEVGAWANDPRRAQHDVILALAIIHKLQEPNRALQSIAESARELVVIRLPKGSKGYFVSKHHGTPCDVNKSMARFGFALEHSEPGPHTELVQYWRRR